jgi:GNAT superfamily N-acetyltransferase
MWQRVHRAAGCCMASCWPRHNEVYSYFRFCRPLGRYAEGVATIDELRAIKFEVSSDGKSHYDDFLFGMIGDYNRRFVPGDFSPLFVYCSDQDGELIGGLFGRTLGGYLEVAAIWVSESYQRNGIGTKLLRRAEQEALTRGCKRAQLDVYDFQALAFCLKHGYKQFAALDGYFGAHTRHLLVKSLT